MLPESDFHDINGLRYHVQVWGRGGERKIFLLHGWGDSGLTFQFLAEELIDGANGDLELVAPDWRGFGQSEPPHEGYWFPDYFADLDQIVDIYSPTRATTLVGHSMGGHIACMYAGIRPKRVAQLVAIEGLGLRPIDADEAPLRFSKWLDELKVQPRSSRYEQIDELAEKLCRRSGTLEMERARIVAAAWTRLDDDGSGYVVRADPRHKRVNPVLYRHEEVVACWRRIEARTMSVAGETSAFLSRYEETGVYEILREAIEEFQVAVIPGAGHMIHHEQPARLAEVIGDWLR